MLYKLNLKPLESGNIITGVIAAVMTECVLKGVSIAYALISLRDSYLEPETLLACVDPIIALFSNGDDSSSSSLLLLDKEKMAEKAAQIKEHRIIDRENLYM